jgi:hypothetical protein
LLRQVRQERDVQRGGAERQLQQAALQDGVLSQNEFWGKKTTSVAKGE